VADLQVRDFRQFFFELHGKSPFPWQEALAERVCDVGWPRVIDLPTASGKTACIDIALFALALRGTEAPRRIFFVVDRRVVVNEAYLRMKAICTKLCEAKAGMLGTVAGLLKGLACGDEPLRVYEMRGGAFRDETWVRNPLQPTVVASTVDQVGSRLLFRGYGVSEHSWPIHAGLIGNDALILLDEAHCSRAFAQTLQRIEKYRGEAWAEDPIRAPFRFVEMTATPSRDSEDRFRITDADRRNETFGKRLGASKPTRLKEAKAKADDFGKLADELILRAIELANGTEARRVAIMVNRVRTAKLVHKKLVEKVGDAGVELVIGRMRAIDRDMLYQKNLEKLKSGTPRRAEDPITFIVSTQCLEVGADLDFDVLVSECASIDALQQRFGRLDRLGEFGRARGAIVIASWQANAKQPDPVYGDALAKTWEWLKHIGGPSEQVDMAIEALDGQPPTAPQLLASVDSREMRLQGEDAPILLPAHVDALVQTSPVPAPDPFVEVFLHGPERGMPDVYVVWRADLDYEASDEKWIETLRLCPPSSPEAMPVPIRAFRKWFAGENTVDDQESDLPLGTDEPGQNGQEQKRALVWQGGEGKLVKSATEIKPGQTIVMPVSAKGWDELGYIPGGAELCPARADAGDAAAFRVRGSVSLRLHPRVMEGWPERPTLGAVKDYAAQDDAEWDEMKERFRLYFADLDADPGKPWPHEFLSELNGGGLRAKLGTYPGTKIAYVVDGRKIRRSPRQRSERVLLEDHLKDIEAEAEKLAAGFDEKFTRPLRAAAKFHDYGKVDARYQAWLLGGDLMAARYTPKPVAKSGSDPVGKQDALGLPKGFRHELLSLMFAEKSGDVDGEARDLMLHLIASHHGRCRPFPPVIPDENAECVTYGGVSICKQERLQKAPYRLDGGIADRFWRLTRKHGWWGLAYLEALLRLADWRASEVENAEAPE
jgi:CRISPR-associated endonuclease/helicase Cas3